MGIESNLRRARSLCFWSGVKNDLQEIYNNCRPCHAHFQRNSKEPYIQRHIPEYPFQHIGIDLASYAGRKYLICVDYFSNYILVDGLSTEISGGTIALLKKHFMRFGIPLEIVSDCGPQFDSLEFKNFSKQYGFEWNPSSPTYPRSNGMAESAVKQVKSILRKCEAEDSDPHLAVLEFLNTPSKQIQLSPAQRFFDRELRSIHPVAKSLLLPKNSEHIQRMIKQSKDRQRVAYNKGAKKLCDINIGQQIMIEPYGTHKTWQPGEVINKHSYRKYILRTSNGTVITRNRIHIRPRYGRLLDDTDTESYYDVSPECIPNRSTHNDNEGDVHDPHYDEHVINEPHDNVVPPVRAGRTRRAPDRYGEWVTG